MNVPIPTPIYRIIHLDSLRTILTRMALHAPNFEPEDGLTLRHIHHVTIQGVRKNAPVSCGPGGTLHDYVPFYFGQRSPMLYSIHTGFVEGCQDQSQVIYLTSDVQTVQTAGYRFVFTDGHAIKEFTGYYDRLEQLREVPWEIVNLTWWNDTLDYPDRKRQKQAEFLIYQHCSWGVIGEIGVINQEVQQQVREILTGYPENLHCPVNVHRDWYYD